MKVFTFIKPNSEQSATSNEQRSVGRSGSGQRERFSFPLPFPVVPRTAFRPLPHVRRVGGQLVALAGTTSSACARSNQTPTTGNAGSGADRSDDTYRQSLQPVRYRCRRRLQLMSSFRGSSRERSGLPRRSRPSFLHKSRGSYDAIGSPDLQDGEGGRKQIVESVRAVMKV